MTNKVIDDKMFSQYCNEVKFMYALSFQLITRIVAEHWNGNKTNIYGEIRKILVSKGFTREQRTFYYANSASFLECQVAIQLLIKHVVGFKESVESLKIVKVLDDSNSNMEPMLDWFQYEGVYDFSDGIHEEEDDAEEDTE